MLTKQLIYRNRRYGFAILFPSWWKSYVTVDRNVRGTAKEAFLSFRFRYKDKVYDPIFTLDISTLTGKDWKAYFGDSPVTFAGQHQGLTYGYILPSELPSEFLRPDKQKYDYAKYGKQIHILKKLVDEVPIVLRSLHFIPRSKLSVAGCSSRRRRKPSRRRG